MSTYEETVREHLRVTLLRLLEEQPDYRLNESLLADLSEHYGFTPSRDRIRTELNWLDEQCLIGIEREGIWVAVLTQRGCDVARGRVTVPGVKRPTPRR